MPGVSQISPPIRIVLGAAIAFLAIYMVFLRPKTDATPAPAPATPAGNVNTGAPAQTGLGKAVESAKSAAAATDAASAKSDAGSLAAGSDSTGTQSTTGAATGTATANGAKTPPATPASAKASGLPLPVLKAVAQHKVLALLFWNPKSPDDQLVHKALKKVERFHGEVFIHAAPISKVSRYARITRGADVEQASTVVIVDRKLRSTNLVGYVTTVAIDQAVLDALRSSGGLFKTDYLKRVNGACSSVVHDMVAMPQAMTVHQGPRALGRAVDRFGVFVHQLRVTPAPARLHGFHRTLVADAAAMQAFHRSQVRALGKHPTLAQTVKVAVSLDSREPVLGKKFGRTAAKQGLAFCA
jgi:hypothetical protein